MSIAVIIATYGDERWRDLALSRAHPSTAAQDAYEVILHHVDAPRATLAAARNSAASAATADWLCFLDADDELAPGYLNAMRRAMLSVDSRALLIPRVQYVRGRNRDRPKFPAWRPGADGESLQDGNWLVIGTLIQRQLFWEVGGFEEWPMYEDWALWARAWKAGAQLVQVPDAVYIAHRQRGSRNVAGENQKRRAHAMIRRAVFPELYEEAT